MVLVRLRNIVYLALLLCQLYSDYRCIFMRYLCLFMHLFFRTRNVSFNLSRFSNRSEWRGKWFSIENTNKKLRNMNHWKCFYDAIWRLTARLLVIRKLLGNCWILFRLFVFLLNELNGIYLKTSDYINNKMSSFIYFSLNLLNSWGD